MDFYFSGKMDANAEEQNDQGQLDDIQNYLTTFNKGIASSDEPQADQPELYNISLAGEAQTTVNGTASLAGGAQNVMAAVSVSQPDEKAQDMIQPGQTILIEGQPSQQSLVDTSGQIAIPTQGQGDGVIMATQADMSTISLDQMQGQHIMIDSSQPGITVIDPTQAGLLAQQGIAQPQIIQQQVLQQATGLGSTLVFQPVIAQGMSTTQDIAQVAAAVSQTMPVVQPSQIMSQVSAQMTGNFLEAAAIQTLAAAQSAQAMNAVSTAQESGGATSMQTVSAEAQEEEPEQDDTIETKTEQIEAKKEEVGEKKEEEQEPDEDEAEDEESQLVQGQVENVGNTPQTQGQGDFQTVTLVPSEANQSGEVSYVLIVSQGEEGQNKGDESKMDMSVYDFQEEARAAGAAQTEGDEETQSESKIKIVKVTQKKPQPQSGSQLMCNYCNYTSTKRYLLTRHMKSHSEERPHKCNICDRAFKTIASLQNHINTHTGTRPHKCKECDAAFTTSGELVRHVRYRHTFEKPHKCPECDYASVELSKLKRHIRSHTGERPYQCPHCSYASPDTYKLKRHLRVHTGNSISIHLIY